MTDFDGHLKIGVATASVCALIAIRFGFQPAIVGVFTVLIVVTSLLPDIDIHSSIPRRYFGYVLLIGGVAGTLWVGIVEYQVLDFFSRVITSTVGVGIEIAQTIGVVLLIAVGLLLAVTAGEMVDKRLTHRGRTHTLTFGILLGVITAGGLWWQGFSGDRLLLAFIAPVIGVGAHVYVGDS